MIKKIPMTDIEKNSVATLPTRPNDRSAYGTGGLSSAQLRARMDALALLAIAKYNELVDAIGKDDADGLVSMLPSGVDGKSVKVVLEDVRSGALAGYLTAYDNEAVLKNMQTIVTELYEKLEAVGDGATFTPYVDEEGNLSWINDGGRENPPTVNIMGSKLVRTEYVGTNEDGGNIYRQYYSDGAKSDLVSPMGDPGRDGTDGKTPYIKDGTWWIGTENTGVPASGGGASLPQNNALIAVGEYMGTGECDNYVNELTFDFKPKFLFVAPREEYGMNQYLCKLIACGGGEWSKQVAVVTIEDTMPQYVNLNFDENKVTWYSFTPDAQMNVDSQVYVYVAIGEAM